MKRIQIVTAAVAAAFVANVLAQTGSPAPTDRPLAKKARVKPEASGQPAKKEAGKLEPGQMKAQRQENRGKVAPKAQDKQGRLLKKKSDKDKAK
jgi:hypothetical protein